GAADVMDQILSSRRYREMRNLAVQTAPSVALDVVQNYERLHPNVQREEAIQWYATHVLERRWFCLNGIYACIFTRPAMFGLTYVHSNATDSSNGSVSSAAATAATATDSSGT
ncbi:MAG: hypothetical protein LC650_01290, partial [Actinobacteria bacterium]|nr:hypothetical protein [Actinomycetota bacterium]